MTYAERVDPERVKSAAEAKALEDVRRCGVHLLHVFNPTGAKPEFSYSMGLWHSYRHPEIPVFGLKQDLRHAVLNFLKHEISKGHCFGDGMNSREVLRGFTSYFQSLPKGRYREYLGWNVWFYGGLEFEAVQMLWPNTSGAFPWDRSATDDLKWMQPILTELPVRVC